MKDQYMFYPMFNIFCEDVEKQKGFYAEILGWKEVMEASSPICRVLQQGDTKLTFNGMAAYLLLNLKNRERAATLDFPIGALITFVVEDYNIVDRMARRVVELGGGIIKYPFATYYGHWQLVFHDPEGNVARITATSLPEGQEIPILNF